MATRATMVFNPAAGQREVRGHLRNVVGYLAEKGWTVDWRETTPEIGATEIAREAAEAGAEVIIAAGGDGTINAVVNGLVGFPDVRLGILPTGTANVWAVESGISNVSLLGPNLEAAGEILVNGVTVDIDVGQANDRYFLLFAGVGFDALVTSRIDSDAKKHMGSFAYALTAIREGLRYRGARIHVTIDGDRIVHNGWVVTINNSRLYALVPLAREASVVDGELDIGIFVGRGWPKYLQHIVSVLLGRQRADPGIHVQRGREILIESQPPLPVHVDAEPAGTTPVHFKVLPRALKVIFPPEMARTVRRSAFRFPTPDGNG